MTKADWQLIEPIDAVIFDCDGTLSKIEGIDELASGNHVSEIVHRLTQEAMGKTGMNVELYEKRLQLVNPTEDKITALGKKYIKEHTLHARDVISVLKSLNKPIYIISAGIYSAVAIFARWLEIPENHVYAVDIKFDDSGRYLGFDTESSLVCRKGKRVIVDALKQKHARLAYIGDGLNDYEVQDQVTRFIGYGGAYYRQNIADLCDYYIKSESIAPVLPLVMTHHESQQLTNASKKLYNEGIELINTNQVSIK